MSYLDKLEALIVEERVTLPLPKLTKPGSVSFVSAPPPFSEPKSHPASNIPSDLYAGIVRMAERWQYSPSEVAYALQKASEDPIAWRDFVTDDERWLQDAAI